MPDLPELRNTTLSPIIGRFPLCHPIAGDYLKITHIWVTISFEFQTSREEEASWSARHIAM